MKSYRRYLLVLLCVWFTKSCFAGTLVQFQIYDSVNFYLGEVDVALYDQDKPITVSNFLRLIESGAYDNCFFHRLVPDFVLQGGGFFTYNVDSTNIFGPPYSNLGAVPNFGNIPDEIEVGPFHSNAYGTIAMAKAGAPGTANSQFYFNLVNNPSLDSTNSANSGGYTVFGQVVRGTNILNEFNQYFALNNGIVDLVNNYGSTYPATVFTSLPNYLIGTNAPPYYDLIYFTVGVLKAQIQLQTNGARQISWNTVNAVTNNVEYTTNLSTSWQVLTNPVGTGFATNVLDTSTNKTGRFYRIHVLF